jgi:hypothetical protein
MGKGSSPTVREGVMRAAAPSLTDRATAFSFPFIDLKTDLNRNKQDFPQMNTDEA